MALSIEDRKFIRENLPYGAQKEIASKLGISPLSVNQYLSGIRNSSKIENAVIGKYEEVKKRREEIKKIIYG